MLIIIHAAVRDLTRNSVEFDRVVEDHADAIDCLVVVVAQQPVDGVDEPIAVAEGH